MLNRGNPGRELTGAARIFRARLPFKRSNPSAANQPYLAPLIEHLFGVGGATQTPSTYIPWTATYAAA